MAIHLNYDGNQNNGIIFNNTYTTGALFKGANFKPTLSFNYDSFQMSEQFTQVPNYVIVNGTRRAMTPSEAQEIRALAVSWVQAPDQEGGTQWLANRAQVQSLASEIGLVCTNALATAGYTTEQIQLFYPNYTA